MVSNTKERIDEIKGRIPDILAADSLSAAEASQLRGRLGVSNTQTFGREGAYAYLALGPRASGSGAKTRVTSNFKASLKWWVRHFDSAKPRRVKLDRNQVPVVPFTDGSCEHQGDLYSNAEVGAAPL